MTDTLRRIETQKIDATISLRRRQNEITEQTKAAYKKNGTGTPAQLSKLTLIIEECGNEIVILGAKREKILRGELDEELAQLASTNAARAKVSRIKKVETKQAMKDNIDQAHKNVRTRRNLLKANQRNDKHTTDLHGARVEASLLPWQIDKLKNMSNDDAMVVRNVWLYGHKPGRKGSTRSVVTTIRKGYRIEQVFTPGWVETHELRGRERRSERTLISRQPRKEK